MNPWKLLTAGLVALGSFSGLSARNIGRIDALKDLNLPQDSEQTTHVMHHRNHVHAQHDISSCKEHSEGNHWHFKVKNGAGKLVDSGRYCRGEIHNKKSYEALKEWLIANTATKRIKSYQINEHEGVEYVVIENPFKNAKGNKQDKRKDVQMEHFCRLLDVSETNDRNSSKMIVMVSAKALANNPNPYMPPQCLKDAVNPASWLNGGVSESPFPDWLTGGQQSRA